MTQKYVKLFESFEDSDEMQQFSIGSPEHTKAWTLSVQKLDEKIGELKSVMDQMDLVTKKIEELEKELNLSDLKQHEGRLLEDIKIAMESINKSNHKVHGLVLKHRKGTLRWNPPSQKLMLEIIELELEGGKELINKLKTESAFKQPVEVSSSLSVKRDDASGEGVTEAEEMEMKKPWYAKIKDRISDWLSSFRKKIIGTSVKLEGLVSEFEKSLEIADYEKKSFHEKNMGSGKMRSGLY